MRNPTFIDNPLGNFANESLSKVNNSQFVGRKIAHHKVISLLGHGGMGDVFLAEDTILKRKAALKFLPDEFTNDRERTCRFETEA